MAVIGRVTCVEHTSRAHGDSSCRACRRAYRQAWIDRHPGYDNKCAEARRRARGVRNIEQLAADRQAKREAEVRRCKTCQEPAAPGRPYCSDACLPARTRSSRPDLIATLERTCSVCQAPFTTRKPNQLRCPAHAGRSAPWSMRRHQPGNRDKNARRRARRAAVPSVRIDPVAIFERDGWRCRPCGGAIDRRLRYPDPLTASLDHVIPLAAGGHHVPSNVAAAHLVCNLRKGAKVA